MKKLSYLLLCTFLLIGIGCSTSIEGIDSNEVITVSNNNIEVECVGGIININVNSLCSWELTGDKNCNWISVSKNNGEKGESTLDIFVDENIDNNNRTTTLTLFNDIYDVSQIINISQNKNGPYINISENNIELVDTHSIVISSNIPWEAKCDAEWINLSIYDKDKYTKVMQIKALTAISDRKCTIKITNDEYGISEEINILQDTKLTIDKSSILLDINGSPIEVKILSSVTWTAKSNVNWIKLSQTEGNGSVVLNVSAEINPSNGTRSAIITIANSELGISHEIEVTQEGPYIKLSAENIEFISTGESKSITIDSNITWNARITEEWLSFTPKHGNIGQATYTIEATANFHPQARNTKIFIENNNYQIVKVIYVNQENTTFTPTDDNCTICYASTHKVDLNSENFGANIITHTYENNIGTIKFDGPIKSIPKRAFSNTSIYLIKIPNTVISIEDEAFYSCDLIEIELPNCLRSIGKYAFFNCNIQEVIIPESVTFIGSFALPFNIIYCKPTTPPQCESLMFGTSNNFVYVPSWSVGDYKSTPNWNYYNIIGKDM